MITTDVLVIGAGPAGTASAIELARQGRSVLVADKAVFPRDKCCGDGLTTEALRLLERLDVRPETVHNWNTVTDVVIRNPRGRVVQLPLPTHGTYAAVVPRLDLDNRLVERARQEGVAVVEGTSFADLRQHDDRVEAEFADGTVAQARYLIAADGMWSPVRKSLELGPSRYRGEWHAFRQYFGQVGPQAQHLVVWFEDDLLPGYAWSFPLPGQRANVGFGIPRDGRRRVQDMGALWSDLLQRPHIADVLGPRATPEDRHKAWPIPARVDDLPAGTGRVLFVGDAVGATDPMTGEGIAQALMTGIAAAAAVTTAGSDDPTRALDLYRAHLRHNLIPDHVFARRLANVLRSRFGTRAALRAADLSDWTRRNFARWMFEDYPRALILTPRRWRRGMFTPPGAFVGDTDAVRQAPARETLGATSSP